MKGEPSTRSPHPHDLDIFSSEPSDIINRMHKEVYDSTKDAMDAYAILLHVVDSGNPRSINLVRVQLKLGQNKLTAAEVKDIAQGMITRAGPVMRCLAEAGYVLRTTTNILVTTRQPVEDKVEAYPDFKVFGPKELAAVWP